MNTSGVIFFHVPHIWHTFFTFCICVVNAGGQQCRIFHSQMFLFAVMASFCSPTQTNVRQRLYAAVLYLSSPKNRMIASSLWLLSLNSLNFIDAKIKKKKKKLYWSNMVMHSEICSLHFTARRHIQILISAFARRHWLDINPRIHVFVCGETRARRGKPRQTLGEHSNTPPSNNIAAQYHIPSPHRLPLCEYLLEIRD